MLDILTDPAIWAAFLTLTAMEIVLGVDNIVFISVLVSRLPREQAEFARKLGIALAAIFRIVMLFLITLIVQLQDPVLSVFGLDFSWKDIILIGGGGFLVYKATHEMHAAIEGPHEDNGGSVVASTVQAVIVQIVIIDMVFSIDSIITAVGMVPADQVGVMIAAVMAAVGVMIVASGPVARFVSEHPTTKMLALAFLLLIGVTLVAEGFGFHLPKGYIYSAMAFSVLVEAANIFARQRRRSRRGKPARAAGIAPFTGIRGSVDITRALAATSRPGLGPAPAGAGVTPPAEPARPRNRATPQRRSQSRPKSAPRKPKS